MEERGPAMTLGDRMAEAMTTWLATVLTDTAVDNRIEVDRTTEATTRAIVETTSCEQRAPHLRHIYNLTGQIILRQIADADDAETTFRARCQELRNALRHSDLVQDQIMANDGRLHLYTNSFHADGQGESSGKRGFQAIYEWRAVARDNPTT